MESTIPILAECQTGTGAWRRGNLAPTDRIQVRLCASEAAVGPSAAILDPGLQPD